MGLLQSICLVPLPGELLITLRGAPGKPNKHLLGASSVQSSQERWDRSPSGMTCSGFVTRRCAGWLQGSPIASHALRGTEGWAEVLPPGLVAPTALLLFGYKWATSPVPCLTVGSCRKPGQALQMQLCCKAGFGLGTRLPSPARRLLYKAPAAPSWAGDGDHPETPQC